MIDRLIDLIDNDRFINMLIYELSIDTKKKNNLPLNNDELLFDNYLIKPSLILNILYRSDSYVKKH